MNFVYIEHLLHVDSLFNKSQFATTCRKEGEASAAAGRQPSVAEKYFYEHLYEHLCE